MSTVFKYPHTDNELRANWWEEVSAEEYDDMLGCVPPIRRSGPAFLVGECLCGMNDGREVYQAYVEVDERFFKKPKPLNEFDPAAFVAEVRQQLTEWPDGKLGLWEGGAGFILSRGRQAIWETATFGEMKEFIKDRGFGDRVENGRPVVNVS